MNAAMNFRTPWTGLLLGTVLVLAAASCSRKAEAPKPSAPSEPSTEIAVEAKKGEGIELLFGIEQQDVNADGSRTLQARGTYKGTPVGLILALGPKWETVTPEDKAKFVFHTGTVEYRTIGEPSNAFLAALDELFGTKLAPKAMRASTKFTAASLQGDPTDLAKGEVRLKLGFESADPALAAELYTNIDLQKHQMRIREKDASFRPALVRALAKP
jgi:hypothetical protein